MSRLALVIGCPGDHVVLAGVPKDVNHMRTFLTSPEGGSWKDSEIIVSNPSTASEVLALVAFARRRNPDYGYIYFTGHGGINRENNRMVIEIKTGQDVYADSITIAQRELAVFDTCRTHFTPIAPVLESRAFGARQDGQELDTSRYFNAAVDQCEIGRIEIYSSSIGEASNDTPDGGLFTVNFLGSSVGFSTITDYPRPIDCGTVFMAAKKAVEAKKPGQHPSIEGSIRRRNFFPISVGIKIQPSKPVFR